MHHDQQRKVAYHPDSVPTQFTVDDAVRNDNVQGVVSDTACKLERNAVLGEIYTRFCRILFEPHGASQRITYLYIQSDLSNQAEVERFRNRQVSEAKTTLFHDFFFPKARTRPLSRQGRPLIWGP